MYYPVDQRQSVKETNMKIQFIFLMVKGNIWIHYQLAYDVFKVLNIFKELLQLCLTGRSSGFFGGQQPVGSRVGFLCCGGVDSFGFVGSVVGFAGRSGRHLRC